jgi:hypothetical protein
MTHAEARTELVILRFTETEAMNLWQDNGKVSDNAVKLTDVAESDLGPAMEWLKRQH